MTQRVFDIYNEKDYADLWDILPDDVFKITKQTYNDTHDLLWYNNGETSESPFGINWRDKTEITRPVQEATEADIGKICYFWEGKDFAIGVLAGIGDNLSPDIYRMEDGKGGIWYVHCRRLTKQEIEGLC